MDLKSCKTSEGCVEMVKPWRYCRTIGPLTFHSQEMWSCNLKLMLSPMNICWTDKKISQMKFYHQLEIRLGKRSSAGPVSLKCPEGISSFCLYLVRHTSTDIVKFLYLSAVSFPMTVLSSLIFALSLFFC